MRKASYFAEPNRSDERPYQLLRVGGDRDQRVVNVTKHSRVQDPEFSIRQKREQAVKAEMLRQKEEKIRGMVRDIINSGQREQECADIIEGFIAETINEKPMSRDLLDVEEPQTP